MTSANLMLLVRRFRATVARESTISCFNIVAVCSTTRVERILCRTVWNLSTHVSQLSYEALYVGAYCKSPNCNSGCFVCEPLSETTLILIVKRGSPRRSLSVRHSEHQRLFVICSTGTFLKGKRYLLNMQTKYMIPGLKAKVGQRDQSPASAKTLTFNPKYIQQRRPH